ncbi:MAG: NusG domain II-containing protein [Cellulosilyticaceae bacterium]
MKKWDKIIIVSLLLLSFVPHMLFGILQSRDYHRTYVVVTVGGKPYMRVPLTGQMSLKEYSIETEYGNNLLVIENEQVAIVEADCTDKICIEPGFISKPGQSLICLPHKLYVEIEGVSEDEDQIDIKAY